MTKTEVLEKTDLYKERPEFFRAPSKPILVELGEASYLVIDGEGSPDQPSFLESVGALYKVAYSLKFEIKKTRGQDFKVPTFEGDWWVQGVEGYIAAQAAPHEQWRWSLFMMLPDFVTQDDVEGMKAHLIATAADGRIATVRFERLAQGQCVQVLHKGPYADEARTIDAIQAFMREEGLVARGPHHEVYLGDPRRAKPEALKTILRQPVRRRPA